MTELCTAQLEKSTLSHHFFFTHQYTTDYQAPPGALKSIINAYAKATECTLAASSISEEERFFLGGGGGLLAHLSRRRPSSFTMLKALLLQTVWPIKAKFYVKPPWVGGTKVCSRHLGHMTATPIYGINPSKTFFSGTSGSISTKLGM